MSETVRVARYDACMSTDPNSVSCEIAPFARALIRRDQHPAHVYIASLSQGSRPSMRGALLEIARHLGCTLEDFPWAKLRYAHTVALRAWLAATYTPGNAKRYLSALRGVLRTCFRLNLMDHDAYSRAIAVAPIRGSRLARGRSLEGAEVRALFEVCEPSSGLHGVRNAAILALLYGAGLRRAELCAIDLDRVDERAVRVVGKGDKERAVELPEGAREALAAWIDARGREPGPLFVPLTKSGRIVRPLKRLSMEGLYVVLRTLCRRAGIKDASPHDIRRTYAGDLLDNGADLVTVQRLMGHSTPVVTAIYDRRCSRSRRAAADRLHVPYELAKARREHTSEAERHAS